MREIDMKEINITDIENINIGNFEDASSGTGCTVIICKNGAATGVDIRGGGPASRETWLLNPTSAAKSIHACLLTGGSAFGLDCAGGVMNFLEDNNIGFDTGVTKVPLVCASAIFDLVVGDKNIRPDKKMGYLACENAMKNNFKQGNYGVGAGATVGKLCGTDYMMKSGVGAYAISIGNLKIGAIVCVNALGDVFDEKNNIIAGMLNSDKTKFADTTKTMYQNILPNDNLFSGNTTIGTIITNAKFDKAEMTKIAQMAHNAYGRTIKPVNTTADGDSVYAMSVGDEIADINVVGTLAMEVMEVAIRNGVKNAKPMFGLKTFNDFN